MQHLPRFLAQHGDLFIDLFQPRIFVHQSLGIFQCFRSQERKPCSLFVSIFRIRVLPEHVKGHKTIFLQKIHLQPGIKDDSSSMDITVRNLGKGFRAFFKNNNRINLPHVLIRELLSAQRFCPRVLTHHQIRRVTGHPFCRESIGDLLDFYIGQ